MSWFAEADLPVAVLVVAVGGTVLGFAIDRWSAAVIPPLVLATYYLGLRTDTWGNGVGDFWWAFMVVLSTVGSAAAAVGIAVRSLVVNHIRGTPSEV